MISTHWRTPHSPTEEDFRSFDVLARQAADLIERSLAEEALRESDERFRFIANTAPVMIWMSGAEQQITYFNQTWLDYTGPASGGGAGVRTGRGPPPGRTGAMPRRVREGLRHAGVLSGGVSAPPS